MLVEPDEHGKWTGVWNYLSPADLRRWRLDRGLSQRRLSALLGMGERTVMRWESGEVNPPAFLTLALIALDQGIRLDKLQIVYVPSKNGRFTGFDRTDGPSLWTERQVERQVQRFSQPAQRSVQAPPLEHAERARIAEWIKYVCAAYTRSQIARMAGVTENKVQQWELGDISSSDQPLLERLAATLERVR